MRDIWSLRITWCPLIVSLFNHLIGERNQPRWNGEAEGFGSPEIDDELELGRLQDWQIAWLCAFQDLSNIVASLSVGIRDIRSVADQSAVDGIFTKLINGGQLVLCRKLDDPFSPSIEKRIRCHKQRAHVLFLDRCQAGLKFGIVAAFDDAQLL